VEGSCEHSNAGKFLSSGTIGVVSKRAQLRDHDVLLLTPEPKSIRSRWIISKFECVGMTWGSDLSVTGLKLSVRKIGVGFSW
jgi:hypothetical protein